MENRVGNSNGAEIPRKSRSLDLKSLYKSRISMESQHKKELKRKIGSQDCDDEKNNKRKKSSKTVSISSFKNVDNTKNSSDEVYNGVVSLVSHDEKGLKLGLSNKRGSGTGFNGISMSLDDSGFRIPKRKRGFVGRKKVEVSLVSKPSGQSCGNVSIDDPVAKVTGDDSTTRVDSQKDLATRLESPPDLGTGVQSSKESGTCAVSLKVKHNKSFDNLKENSKGELNGARLLKEDSEHANNIVVNHSESSLKKVSGKSESNLNQHLKEGEFAIYSVVNDGDSLKKSNKVSNSNLARFLKEEDVCAGHLVVNNSNLSFKKSSRNHGKRKDSAHDRRSFTKEAEPLIDTSVKLSDDMLEDEENLEENAAMMLSSRFDPSCTGFSSNGKSIATTDGFSFLLSSEQEFGGHESTLFDATGRALRPRTQHKERGHSRKRRHYYEIFSGDLDAYWVLNRRIKVFWPLDKCWYYGLVNDYDEEKKLHHVKYDDRDEEWINLGNERFKLLLLPSEVPSKASRRRSRTREKLSEDGKGSLKPSKQKEKRNMTTEDDNYMGSYMDTEPIISWLARSTNRVKASPLHAMKKQKRPDPSLTCEQPFLSTEVVNAYVCLEGTSSNANNNKLSSKSELLDRFADSGKGEESSLGSSTCSKDSKLPIVYYRRRYRKTGSLLCVASSGNHVSSCTPAAVTLPAPSVDGFEDLEEHDICMKISDPEEALWSTGNTKLLNPTIPLTELGQVRFEICFPVLSVLNYTFGAENLWLFRAVFLFHYGTLMTIWPRVSLEMLFVDNVDGLRFFVFEGCLKQAVACVFLVLRVFHKSNERANYADPKLPVTSIRFKFSCIHDLKKQFVFAFYNFSEVKNFMWMHLDSKLKRCCRLHRQLSLSECTYDNIRVLQNGSKLLSTNSVSRDNSSAKGLRRMSGQVISRVSPSVKVGQFSFSDENGRNFPPFALSFAAAPTFFLSLHLKLLMEHRADHIIFQDHGSVELPQSPVNLIVDDCSSLEYCLNKDSEITQEKNMSESTLENNVKDTLGNGASDGCFSVVKSGLAATVCVEGHWLRSPQKYENGGLIGAGTSASSRDPEETNHEEIDLVQKWQCNNPKLEQCVLLTRPSVDTVERVAGSQSPLNGMRVEIPTFDQFEKHGDREFHSAQRSTDLSWNMNGGIIPSPNPTAPRSTWHRTRSSSSSFGYLTHGWSDGKADAVHNNFGNGPKKPRTQVYSLPFGGFDYSSKSRGHHQKGLPHTRLRKANEKRLSDVSRGCQKDLELLCCDANVLITHGDKGWRECGAQIVLELFDHNEWKLAVKVSGSTRYSYKAHQFLQPGSTNRYTHAMIWKGGKDWTLEFPDRSQWFLFKEMHEECYNRNIRAALFKNIPIPGVRLIEESDDNGTEVAFVRSSSKYFRQVETDVEMALDPSRNLYDMDSDDEQWLLKIRNSSEADSSGLWELSEEMFEKTMDMFEKVAYSQRRDQFTSDELEELMTGVGSMEAIKIIYEHWRQKRQKKGMPLIRHLQPPLWEIYQQQVKVWDLAMSKTNYPNGCKEKVAPIEKPLMFAFCLKPRGLEVPNKGSKHRSHRKISVSGQSNTVIGDHDGFHTFGRRLNGFTFGDEKVAYTGHNYESLEDSPLSQTSPRVFSPRVFSPHDASGIGYFSMSADRFDRNQYQKLQRSKSKKFGTFEFSCDPQMMASYNQRLMAKRNGIHRWNMGYSEWPSQRHLHPDGSHRHGPGQLDGSDLDEFRLRDASGAAQHARNMAKLKREKAQRLLYRADLAINKAVNALMIAEAIKASFDDVNSDG